MIINVNIMRIMLARGLHFVKPGLASCAVMFKTSSYMKISTRFFYIYICYILYYLSQATKLLFYFNVLCISYHIVSQIYKWRITFT